MPTLLRLLSSLLCALPGLVLAQGAVVETAEVRAELVAHAPQGVGVGQPMWLGLAIRHQPHWHTYWKNPGDSGLPTRLRWVLPPHVSAGEIEWPTPKRLPVGPLVNYGYEGSLLLPVPLTLDTGFREASLDIRLHAEWLVCKEVCIPQSGDFALNVPVGRPSIDHAAAFALVRQSIPQTPAGATASARVDAQVLAFEATGLPSTWQGRALTFFAEDAGVVDHAARAEQRWDGGRLVMRVPLSAQRSESPATMRAVLVAPGEPAGVALGFAVNGGWPAVVQAAAAPAAPVLPATSAGSWGMALVLAFVGGMLLNLMPCVFPVLSLKVLGFAAHAGDRRWLAAGAVAYSAGVVLSFVSLAAVLLGLRSAGTQLGWGFQLQSPPFVATLVLLFTVIGLNLLGVFEFGSMLPSRLAAHRARHPLVDHALTGVLAVAVASPCTAPFMGAAIGLALTRPAFEALAVFAALGAGMAAPYLAASLWPAFARRLPRPGAWMVHFRHAMAFPMFATVVWLLWVLGQQVGLDAAVALLGFLVALAFAASAFGAQGLGRAARLGWRTVAVAVLSAALAWAAPTLFMDAPAGATVDAAASRWEPWSSEAVVRAHADGHPVFVDFTAAWCVTCQYNKRTTLSDARLLAEFDAKRVILLRADWTRQDARITQELARLGRSGVPVYAVYPPGGAHSAPPRLLSEILSVAEVREAIRDWPAQTPSAPGAAGVRSVP
jgi:thiol:disulfide interchange protein DsbD